MCATIAATVRPRPLGVAVAKGPAGGPHQVLAHQAAVPECLDEPCSTSSADRPVAMSGRNQLSHEATQRVDRSDGITLRRNHGENPHRSASPRYFPREIPIPPPTSGCVPMKSSVSDFWDSDSQLMAKARMTSPTR